jgi:enoyl-CoA hydratase/carnithine racemase
LGNVAAVVDAELLAHGRVRLETSGPVLTVTLDRPEQLNAQTPATWRALAAIGADLPPEVRVVVLRGAGPSFSAGLDRAMFRPQGLPGEASLAQLAALPDDELDAAIAGFQSAFTWWSQAPAVTVAVVQGNAIGAGFQLALACDLRVVADDARFAMKETSLGLVPDLAGTWPLVASVGYARALEICATGRWVGAAEAAAIGLATAVMPAVDLDDTVADLVDALLAAPAGALRETVELLRGAATRTPGEQQVAERAAQARRLRDLGAEGAGTTGVVGGVGETG